MLWAGTRGVSQLPPLGDGRAAFHRVVPHLGTPMLALLWVQRPALFLLCLSFCFSPRVALCIYPVRRVNCVSNSLGIPLQMNNYLSV